MSLPLGNHLYRGRNAAVVPAAAPDVVAPVAAADHAAAADAPALLTPTMSLTYGASLQLGINFISPRCSTTTLFRYHVEVCVDCFRTSLPPRVTATPTAAPIVLPVAVLCACVIRNRAHMRRFVSLWKSCRKHQERIRFDLFNDVLLVTTNNGGYLCPSKGHEFINLSDVSVCDR